MELILWRRRAEFRYVSGIYVIINVVTRDRYVGLSVDVCRELETYERKIRTNARVEMPRMAEDYERYGIGSFRYGLAERVPPDKALLRNREDVWFDRLQPYYNGQIAARIDRPGLFPRNNWDDLPEDVREQLNIIITA